MGFEIKFEGKKLFLGSSLSDVELFSRNKLFMRSNFQKLFLRSSLNDFELFSKNKLFLRLSLRVRSGF